MRLEHLRQLRTPAGEITAHPHFSGFVFHSLSAPSTCQNEDSLLYQSDGNYAALLNLASKPAALSEACGTVI